MKNLFDDNDKHTRYTHHRNQGSNEDDFFLLVVLVFLLNLVDGGFGLGSEVLSCFQRVVINRFKCFFNFW